MIKRYSEKYIVSGDVVEDRPEPYTVQCQIIENRTGYIVGIGNATAETYIKAKQMARFEAIRDFKEKHPNDFPHIQKQFLVGFGKFEMESDEYGNTKSRPIEIHPIPETDEGGAHTIKHNIANEKEETNNG